MAHSHIHPARVWSMLPNQEVALKQFWAILLKYFGYEVQLSNEDIKLGRGLVCSIDEQHYAPSTALTISISKELSLLNSDGSSLLFRGSCNNIKSIYYLLETDNYHDDDESVFSLYHQELHPLLAKYIPEDLHRCLWALGRNDFTDNFVLKFLRMTDFDVKTSLKWFSEMLDWRHNKFGVDELLYKGDSNFVFEGKTPKLVKVMRSNEVYKRGRSRSGCQIVHIRAKMHLRGNCPDKEFEKFIALVFEWARLGLLEYKRGDDRAHVLFDLTGFTLKNADFHAVKFAVKAFQRWYPDVVERLYIHNAPRVFSIMWNIVVKWLKPHLRERIIFTHGFDDLNKYIDPKYIPKTLGGKDHIPPYVEPNSFNCQRKEPDAMFSNLMRQRDELTVRFIEATIKWIEATTVEESRVYLDSKINLSKARAQNYIFLDPYLRTRGITDRNGELSTLSY